ncbi:MAG: twin-arginine translocation signal domain-containing protein, partial [Verrucomicrobiota bacterium]|nr:twin-arginine translocation signal domain-containing protein [Verrucomicrobiota bacterium]
MQTRRQFLGRTSAGIGSVALASLIKPQLFAGMAGFP